MGVFVGIVKIFVILGLTVLLAATVYVFLPKADACTLVVINDRA